MLNKKDIAFSQNLLSSLSFCVVDLETTGGDQNYDNIIEIGLVKITNLKIVDELTFLINPEIPIPEFIQRLTSIREEDIANEKTIALVMEQIILFIGESILVAHNSSFDIPFLNSVLKRMQRPTLNNPSICTNLMTKFLMPEVTNSNLTYAGKLFDMNHNNAHRALEDAKLTANLFLKYLDCFIGKGITKINHLYYPRKRFELDSAHYKRELDPPLFRELLSTVHTLLVITLKGEKGILLDLIPSVDPQNDAEAIYNKIMAKDWVHISLKLQGTFFQVLNYLQLQFDKLHPTKQSELIESLNAIPYFAPISNPNFLKSINRSILISKHLILDQYSVFTLNNLDRKHELIFRYPTHRKRLSHFIRQQIKQLDAGASSQKNKSVGTPLYPITNLQLLHLNDIYLHPEKYPQYMLVSIDEFENKLSSIERFLNKNSNLFNFPLIHI